MECVASKITYTLKLDEREASFLKRLTQNSFEENESVEIRKIRCDIFNSFPEIKNF